MQYPNISVDLQLYMCMQVLACAPSNIAVDNMVERLHQQKVKVRTLLTPRISVTYVGTIKNI